jgi:hypothetical protein
MTAAAVGSIAINEAINAKNHTLDTANNPKTSYRINIV